ncbi:cysteine desulfurase [Edaphobacter acidisoli]|uniref:Cysteine desulfurase n=1 Tax=Edaphobacter acidisoli TaxID=2040573 RepID=A0A916RGT7_9BACT|nr:family 2A encapsulin nanocompartment cargo protein cysteine desulfurase [Edaphobacter acidisoli]GGA55543.1 cysteine desulfurase [Edaphobacter acidisoli]
MSTSDREKFAGESTRRMEDTFAAQNVPTSFMNVAALTEMANEFFRAMPGQAPAQPSTEPMPALRPETLSATGAEVPSAPSQPVPAYETRLPQYGASMSAVPAIPSSQAIPNEVGTGIASTERRTNIGTLSLSPEQLAAPSTATPQYCAQSMTSASPFSIPMPPFEAAFPSFEMTLPDLVQMPLPTEDEVNAALASVSSFYFLEDAGALSKPVASAGKPRVPEQPSTLPDLKLPRNQFDIASVRRDFPILNERVNGHPLIWLDNAATTQKPQAVIDRLKYFYEHENSNIHRAAHELAARATDAYEDARTKVAHFLNAGSSKEIVFVRGATEAINLIAQAWGRRHIQQGDEIIISWIEHHANIVPWQMLAAEKGAKLRVIPVDDDGQILLDEYEKLLNPRTRIVSFTQVSNALGTVTPAHQMVQMAHRYGARVLVDGAQAVSHMPIDVQSLDCDFYVFSGHKVFAPTGIGVVYGKPDALEEMPPWQGGGNMIADVTFEKTVYQAPPSRFEAGTGNIADAVGLGAAIDYLDHIGMANIARYEHELLVYATRGLLTIPGLRLIGTAKEKAGVLSFVLEGFKTEEVGAALNREGIAVRSGHHCAQPSLRRMGVETSVRPSLALYNSFEDIDALIAALHRLKNLGA